MGTSLMLAKREEKCRGTHRLSAATARSQLGLTTGMLAATAFSYSSSIWPPRPESSPPTRAEEQTKCVVAVEMWGASRAPMSLRQVRS